MIYEDEENTLFGVKKLLSYLPSNNLENPPYTDYGEQQARIADEKLRDIVPDDANKPYDVKEVINLIMDKAVSLKSLKIMPRTSSLVLEGWKVNQLEL